MVITVKLFAMLRDKLPPDSKNYEMEMEVPDDATAQYVVDKLEIPAQMAHLVMIDGYHLLPEERTSRTIQPGEVLAIFPPIAGGR